MGHAAKATRVSQRDAAGRLRTVVCIRLAGLTTSSAGFDPEPVGRHARRTIGKLVLSAVELATLDEVSRLPAEYPGWIFERQGEYRRQQLVQARRS